MNGNGVGARTLAYLRGETDWVREQERLARVRKHFQSSGQPFGLSRAQKHRIERFWRVASLLHENSRLSITEMSKNLKIPVSTLFDTLKELEKYFLFTIVLKDREKDALVIDPSSFEFGYQVTIDTSAEEVENYLKE
jgi:hypothetical protein